MLETAAGNGSPFTISFANGGRHQGPATQRLGLPVLGGDDAERIFGETEHAGECGEFILYRSDQRLLGCAVVPLRDGLESQTAQLYRNLFDACRGHHLCRIWNYLPGINAIGPDGLEVYQSFSRARSHAFEAEFGPDFNRRLPAASAVGTKDDQFAIVFAATAQPPRHVENPQQVPAYEYPPEHGPRPPSFARASVVTGPGGLRDVFISGTAAIKGHATIAASDTFNQLACTLENLRDVSRACGVGAALARGMCLERHIKVYLRHAEDFPAVREALNDHFLQSDDHVCYLQADICRAALNLEIEATILGAAQSD